MNAIGVDLGGSKIEVQLFDEQWQVSARNRIATPVDYPALVSVLASQIEWADRQAGCCTCACTGTLNRLLERPISVAAKIEIRIDMSRFPYCRNGECNRAKLICHDK